MGRKPLGDKPMSAAERQRRRRAALKQAQPRHGTVQEFRIALWRFVDTWWALHGDLRAAEIRLSLEQLGLAIDMDEYTVKNPTHTRDDGRVVELEADWVLHYLNYEGGALGVSKVNGENWR